MQLLIQNFTVSLLPQKALWIQEVNALAIADLHLGKASYFQENSIPIPSSVHQADLQRLQGLIADYRPQTLYILGDLFHHGNTLGNATFEAFCSQNPTLTIVWIIGNHDKTRNFKIPNLQIEPKVELGDLLLTHEPVESETDSPYIIAGHEHPAIKLKAGRDSIKLPCFVSQPHQLILPAFGTFTGNKTYTKPKKQLPSTPIFYAIAGDKVVEVR